MKKKATITVMLLAVLVVVVVLMGESVEGVGHTGGHASSSGASRGLYFKVARANNRNHPITNHDSSSSSDDDDSLAIFICVSALCLIILIGFFMEKSTVIRVQVAVKGDPSKLQRDLFVTAKIADAKIADPTTSTGLNFILSETVSRLLQLLDDCYFAYSSVHVIRTVKENWKKSFNCNCDKETKQFDGNILLLRRGASRCNEFVVVTILLAASGTHKLPEINSLADLEKALAYLKSINLDNIHAMKVFWTPEDGHKKLLKRDLDEHFPLLRLLSNIEGVGPVDECRLLQQ